MGESRDPERGHHEAIVRFDNEEFFRWIGWVENAQLFPHLGPGFRRDDKDFIAGTLTSPY